MFSSQGSIKDKKIVSFSQDNMTETTQSEHSIDNIYMTESNFVSPQKQILDLESQLTHGVKISQENSEEILFQLLKLKCKNGILDESGMNSSEQKKTKSCIKIREEMQQQMGEYAHKYCYVVFCGANNEHCWGVCTDQIDEKFYFRVSHKSYTYIVYQTHQDAHIVEEINKSSQGFEEEVKKQQKQKEEEEQKQQEDNFMSSSHPAKSQYRRSTFNGQQQRQSKIIQQQQKVQRRNSDITKLKPMAKKQLKFTQDKLPSKEQIEQIAKQYKKFIGRFIPTKPWSCQDYASAIQQSFKSVGIVPKLVIVKKEPQGDYFWDYECENEGTLHTWDMVQDRGVGICL